jgi:hypothetical protein
MLHDLATGTERVLFTGLDPDMQENFAWTGSYPAYDWTPDGRDIVISYGGGRSGRPATSPSRARSSST